PAPVHVVEPGSGVDVPRLGRRGHRRGGGGRRGRRRGGGRRGGRLLGGVGRRLVLLDHRDRVGGGGGVVLGHGLHGDDGAVGDRHLPGQRVVDQDAVDLHEAARDGRRQLEQDGGGAGGDRQCQF